MAIEKHSSLHKPDKFVTIDSDALKLIQDPVAVAIWVYLLDKPEDWTVRAQDICNRFDIGRDRVTKAFKCLKLVGVLEDRLIKSDTGVIVGRKFFIYTSPHVTENPCYGKNLVTEKPKQGKNRPLHNTDLLHNTDILNNTDVKVEKDGCPVDDIVSIYHSTCLDLPKVKILSEARKKKLKARWKSSPKHQTLEFWKNFFNFVAASDFLNNRNQKQDNHWKADFEWLINEANFIKVIEGKYHAQK